MRNKDLIGQYETVLRKSGKRPVGAVYCPAENRFQWLLEDQKEQSMTIYPEDQPSEVEEALAHLERHCAEKGLTFRAQIVHG